MHQKRSDPLPVIVQAYLRVCVCERGKNIQLEKKKRLSYRTLTQNSQFGGKVIIRPKPL